MNRSIHIAKMCFSFALLIVGFALTAAAGPLYFTGTNTVWDNGTTADWATSNSGPYTSFWQGGSDCALPGHCWQRDRVGKHRLGELAEFRHKRLHAQRREH